MSTLETNSSRINHLDAALAYADRGWHVLPVFEPKEGGCSCGKEGCSIGKHPRNHNGVKGATKDANQIRQWFQRWPNANIGVATGARSGFIVLDIDDKDGGCGSVTLAALESEYGQLPPTLTAHTGNGRHMLFAHPGDVISNSAGRVGPGLDVRAEDGYIVVEPSLHANGNLYKWVDADLPLADIPDWLLEKMAATNEVAARAEVCGETNEEEDIIEEGRRNDELFRLGCALRGIKGMEFEEISNSLLESNASRCKPPLPYDEVITIATSVCGYPASKRSAVTEKDPTVRWFKFDTLSFVTSPNIVVMTAEQKGWLVQLQVMAWNNAGVLPSDKAVLAKMVGASKTRFTRYCEPVLAEFEPVEIDGVPKLLHRELAEQYVSAVNLCRKKANAGRIGADKKKNQQSSRGEAKSSKEAA
jgi:uncharacterized protein YdaU (DUF1376 family)